MRIAVERDHTDFEVCDLGDEYWAAAGWVGDLVVTIDSRGVPLEAVALERINEDDSSLPEAPYLGNRSETVVAGLEERLEQVPYEKVRGWADYWALRHIEIDHVQRLARDNGLSDTQHRDLEAYWLDRIDIPIRDKLDRLHYRNIALRRRSTIERYVRWTWLCQLWSNTVGPGARTWFSNRYVPIRHYTFRIWWRP